MADVVQFKVVDSTAEPNAEVIESLEALLSQAKAGVITALGYATVTNDGSFQTFWTGGKNMNFALCAGIMRLSWRYQDEAFGERTTDHGKPV